MVRVHRKRGAEGLYKIIVVDDETFTVKVLAKAVKWEIFNFELCGVFTNGFECLEYIKEHDVDAVISDIRMPQMDGVELAKKINEQKPDVKIVLASAYKDFEYALEAVRLKVFDYIVKPFDCKTIESVLKRIGEELLKDNSNDKKLFLGRDDNIRVQKLISDFIDQKSRRFLEESIIINGIDLRSAPVVIMNIGILEIEEYLDKVWKYGITGLYNAINNIIGDTKPTVFPLKYSFDNITFILLGDDTEFEKLLHSFESLRDKLVSECFEVLNLSVNVDMLQAGICLEDIISADVQKGIEVQKKMLISIIKEGNSEGISENIARFCDVFSGDELMIRSYFISVLNELINLFGTSEIKRIDAEYSGIFYIKDINELRRRLEAVCIGISKKNEYDDVYDAIKVAKKYVMEHIEGGTSLAEVAEVVSFSPSYFGRVFKEKTGEKFLDFVNRVRIEAAQNYLATTGMKVNEIYEKVGYMSRNYFYNMFKSIAGCSPQEYRARIRKDR